MVYLLHMQSTKFIRVAQKIILYVLVAVMPLFFLPFTLEVLELNKQFFLYGGMLLALMLWLLEGAVARKFVIRRTAFDIPVLVYVGVVAVSGLFSVNRFLSFVGDYNNIQMSVIALLFLAAFGFLITQVFITDKSRLTLLGSAVIGGILSSVWFLLDKFKVLEFADFGVVISNSVSLSNSEFGVYLILLLLGGLALLSIKKRSSLVDGLSVVVVLLALVVILSLGFKVTYILLAVGLSVLLAFMLTYADYLRLSWITTTFALLVVAVLFIFLNTPRIFNFGLPVEVALGVGTSFDVSWSTITDNTKQFLLGSGAATFVSDFSQYKPEALNLNNFAWRIRFGKPFSTFVSMIAETGVLGTLSFIFMSLVVLGHIGGVWMKSLAVKTKGASPFSSKASFVYLVAPIWIVLLISTFFIHLSLNLWLLFFVMLAMLSSVLVTSKHEPIEISLKSSPQYLLVTSFSVVLLFAGGVVFAVFSGRYYAAEVSFARAQRVAASPAAQIGMLTEAVQLNKKNSRYRVALAQSFLNEARVVSGQADGSPELVQRLVAKAVEEARIATDISPHNVSTWETLANMYLNASPFAPGVSVWVTRSFEKAVELEPVNPVLHLQLGRAKYVEGKKTEAKDAFEEAIRLKGDFVDAYIALAGYYELEDDIDRGIAELEKGVQSGRQSDVFLFQLGRLYYNRADDGDWDRALTVFNAALAINPNNANVLYSAGLIYNNRGDREVALRYFEEVLKRDPANEAVASRVKQLRAILSIQ